jgi:DNA-binding NtrC family response regulator
LAAENGERGLEILRAEPVHLIISDLLMPGIGGLEFLRLSHKVRPDAAQILLATQADVNAAIEAINQGRISRFFLKPFDGAQLLEAVGETLTQQQLRQELLNR